MSHDPALEAHEHAEHAEHAAHEANPFIAKVSITVAVLAVLAAAASSLENVEAGHAIAASGAAVLAEEKATDFWNEYQSDSIKRHIYDIAADNGGARAADYRKTAAHENASQKQAHDQATAFGAERDRDTADSERHQERHHWLTAAATLIEIGIALSTVAIITRRSPFWFAAMGLGAVGTALFALAYLG